MENNQVSTEDENEDDDDWAPEWENEQWKERDWEEESDEDADWEDFDEEEYDEDEDEEEEEDYDYEEDEEDEEERHFTPNTEKAIPTNQFEKPEEDSEVDSEGRDNNETTQDNANNRIFVDKAFALLQDMRTDNIKIDQVIALPLSRLLYLQHVTPCYFKYSLCLLI